MSRAEHIPLPNWYIGAGCIPTIVWNLLSENPPETYLHDIDIVYYDARDLSSEAEHAYQNKMNVLYHDLSVKLDIKNQARIHTWYNEKLGQSIAPYDSVEAGINTWLSATAVGVRKCDTDFIVYAPYGLNDLFSMTVRPNRSVMSRQHYFKKAKQWKTQWPRVTIIPWD